MRTLWIGSGRLRVEVLDFGAHLRRIQLDSVDLCRYLDELDGYADRDRNPYLGAIAGRCANRIADARFELDGTVHRLDRNDGDNHLHGGSGGFSFRTWQVTDVGPDHVELQLRSPDGDQGYPGALDVVCLYRVTDTTLRIDLTATTDAPTVVNLATHTYWNLSGDQDETIGDHVLQVPADRYLPVDDALLPIGEQAGVAGTRFDLRSPTPLGAVCAAGGFDHCFVLDDDRSQPDGQAVAAILEHPASGRRLTVTTDRPAVQVYTATMFDPRFGAICLEPEDHPDAPNQPAFPDIVLQPASSYRQRTELHLEG